MYDENPTISRYSQLLSNYIYKEFTLKLFLVNNYSIK